MLRRCLSVCTRKTEQNTNQEIGEAHLENDFDFAFTSEPRLFTECHNPVELEPLRSTNPGGKGYRTKRKPDLTLLIKRPRSSESTLRSNRASSVAGSDGSQIGLAFGSPRQLPQEFNTITQSMNVAQQQHASFLGGPLPVQTTKTKKWKRIAGLCRDRANSNRKPHLYRTQCRDAEAQETGLKTPRNRWRNQNSPLIAQHGFGACRPDVEVPPPVEKDEPCITLHTTPAIEDTKASTRTMEAPSLHIDIPGTPLDRYSVMFRDVHGVQQSRLLFRRSKTFEQLSVNTNKEQKTGDLVVTKLARRVTSPTSLKSQCSSTTTNAQPCMASKYSLFPTSSTSFRFQSSTPSPNQSRSRSITAPIQLSPSHGAFPNNQTISDGHSTLCQGDGTFSHLSDSAIGSPEPLPLASQPGNITLRASSETEVFFDVTSFRNSRGTVGQQFEMTRPPSAAVQLARAKSNARKLLQDPRFSAEQTDRAQDDNDYDRPSKTRSIQIDETIAIVESLTSPSTAPSQTTGTSEPSTLPLQHTPNRDRNHAVGESVIMAMETEISVTKKLRRRSSSETRPGGLNIDVPSPVPEAVEEATPKTTRASSPDSASAATSTVGRMILAHTNHVASRVATPTQSTSSPTPTPAVSTITSCIDQVLSTPPAVPIKDSKFIPLSKYAPKRTIEDLARQTGLRLVRPARSNTDNLVSYNTRASTVRQPPYLERSSTMPAPLAHAPTPKQILSPAVGAGPGSTQNRSKDVPAMVAFVKPVAVISIARTISLSRRPSARVVAPRHTTTMKTTTTHQQAELHIRTDTSTRPPEIPLTRAESKRRVEQSVLGGREEAQEDVNRKKVLMEMEAPTVQEVSQRHKPGVSMEIILETESVAPGIPMSLVPCHNGSHFMDAKSHGTSLVVLEP